MKVASGDTRQVARETGGHASMTANGGCLKCAVVSPARQIERGEPDTCQALCGVASQKMPDAAI